jgi:hypothetical protein
MTRWWQLFTRRGYDWTERYPGIAATAARLRAKSFTLDGEAAVSYAAGIAIFEAIDPAVLAAGPLLACGVQFCTEVHCKRKHTPSIKPPS